MRKRTIRTPNQILIIISSVLKKSIEGSTFATAKYRYERLKSTLINRDATKFHAHILLWGTVSQLCSRTNI